MSQKLKTEIIKFLEPNKKCHFRLEIQHKGHEFELECAGKINEKCGKIYSTLNEWIGYGDFFDYLLNHGNIYHLEGSIFLNENDNSSLIIQVAFLGTSEDYEEPVFIELPENFFIEKLRIDLKELGIKNYKEEDLALTFSIKDSTFSSLVVLKYQNRKPIYIQLDHSQQTLLQNYLLEFTLKNAPILDVDFNCNQIIDAECDGNQIEYSVRTSEVKINWNDLYDE
jgi:hypothetical protein